MDAIEVKTILLNDPDIKEIYEDILNIGSIEKILCSVFDSDPKYITKEKNVQDFIDKFVDFIDKSQCFTIHDNNEIAFQIKKLLYYYDIVLLILRSLNRRYANKTPNGLELDFRANDWKPITYQFPIVIELSSWPCVRLYCSVSGYGYEDDSLSIIFNTKMATISGIEVYFNRGGIANIAKKFNVATNLNLDNFIKQIEKCYTNWMR